MPELSAEERTPFYIRQTENGVIIVKNNTTCSENAARCSADTIVWINAHVVHATSSTTSFDKQGSVVQRGVKNAVSLARRPGTRWFLAGYRGDRGQPRYVAISRCESRVALANGQRKLHHELCPHRREESYRVTQKH